MNTRMCQECGMPFAPENPQNVACVVCLFVLEIRLDGFMPPNGEYVPSKVVARV